MRASRSRPAALVCEQMCALHCGRVRPGRGFLSPGVRAEAARCGHLSFSLRRGVRRPRRAGAAGPVAVDLVDGARFPALPCSTNRWTPSGWRGRRRAAAPVGGRRPRKGGGRACAGSSPTKIRRGFTETSRIEEELDRLYAYLRAGDGRATARRAAVALARAHVAELRELSRPRIEVRARAATLLYAPAYWPNPCAMYLSRRRQ